MLRAESPSFLFNRLRTGRMPDRHRRELGPPFAFLKGENSKRQIKKKGESHEDQDEREGRIETNPTQLGNANKRSQQHLTSQRKEISREDQDESEGRRIHNHKIRR
jgi:hypothetical protein